MGAFLVYRLGLYADFEEEDVVGESDTVDDGWQHIAFVLASVMVTFILINIFIGIVGGAYDHYQDRAEEHFVRARASIGLEYSLFSSFLRRPRKRLDEQYVWFCHQRDGDSIDF